MPILKYPTYLPTVVTRVWLNGLPVNVRIMDVFPTPESPSNRILYVTSFPTSAPVEDDDDIPDDDVVVAVDVDDDKIRPFLSRNI